MKGVNVPCWITGGYEERTYCTLGSSVTLTQKSELCFPSECSLSKSTGPERELLHLDKRVSSHDHAKSVVTTASHPSWNAPCISLAKQSMKGWDSEGRQPCWRHIIGLKDVVQTVANLRTYAAFWKGWVICVSLEETARVWVLKQNFALSFKVCNFVRSIQTTHQTTHVFLCVGKMFHEQQWLKYCECQKSR